MVPCLGSTVKRGMRGGLDRHELLCPLSGLVHTLMGLDEIRKNAEEVSPPVPGFDLRQLR